MARAGRLGADGLPLDSDVLPEMPLPRRMFAGTKTTYHQPIRVGERLTRETELADIQLREGSTGVLIFTNVVARIIGPNGLALEEEARTAFRDEVKPGEKSGIPKRDAPPSDTSWERTITADPVSLFRYSALTFIGHRIHYDRDYTVNEEGYQALLVHGPLTASFLMDLCRRNLPDREITKFQVRAVGPLFDNAPFTVHGKLNNDNTKVELWAANQAGNLAMSISAQT